jgi:urea transporter
MSLIIVYIMQQVCFANNPISGYLILLGLAVGMPIVAAFTVFASTLGILFALVRSFFFFFFFGFEYMFISPMREKFV